MLENSAQFEQRKKDHIRIALDPATQSEITSGLEKIKLHHEALPEINFQDVALSKTLFGNSDFTKILLKSPIFISSMTAGHADENRLNLRLAKAAQERQWVMGVGSQRKELFDSTAAQEWRDVRKQAPNAVLFGNIGLSQLISTSTDQIQKLIDNLEASALFIHVNPLQEVLQKEGTPLFKNGLKSIQSLVKKIQIPVIVKEVGCGFSLSSLEKLKESGVYAVDLAGLGGTHWGRIEGQRSEKNELLNQASETFKNWGISTVESLMNAREAKVPYKIWASGGVRSGLDVAKLIAMGAEMVGVAQPILKAALMGEKDLHLAMERLEYELQIAMFCTGCEDLDQLQTKRIWSWNS